MRRQLERINGKKSGSHSDVESCQERGNIYKIRDTKRKRRRLTRAKREIFGRRFGAAIRKRTKGFSRKPTSSQSFDNLFDIFPFPFPNDSNHKQTNRLR